MAEAIQGVIRSPLFTSQQTSLAASERGEQIVAQGLPYGTEYTRAGKSWSTMSTRAPGLTS